MCTIITDIHVFSCHPVTSLFVLLCQYQILTMTNKCTVVFVMSIRCTHIFSTVIHMNFKNAVTLKKLKNYLFFICIRIADFSWGINDKRIIEFSFHRISELFRPWSALPWAE